MIFVTVSQDTRLIIVKPPMNLTKVSGGTQTMKLKKILILSIFTLPNTAMSSDYVKNIYTQDKRTETGLLGEHIFEPDGILDPNFAQDHLIHTIFDVVHPASARQALQNIPTPEQPSAASPALAQISGVLKKIKELFCSCFRCFK